MQGFAIVSLLLLVAVVQCRQDNCPPPGTISLGETKEVLPMTSDDQNDCALLKLTLPDGFTDDIHVSFTKAGYGHYWANSLAFVREREYMAENTYQTAEFVIQTDFTINNCALYDTNYYLVIPAGAGEVFNLTLTAAAPAPIRQVPAGTTLITGTASQVAWDIVEIPLTDPSRSVYISLVNKTADISFYLYAGGCPTSRTGKFFNWYDDGDPMPYLRTHKPNVPVYLIVDTSFDTDYFVELKYEPVECQIPSGLSACVDAVTYKTAIYDSSEIPVREEEADSYFGLFGSCKKELLALVCGYYFPMCDEQGFPQIPCVEDCENAATACTDKYVVDAGFYPSTCETELTKGVPGLTHCYTQGESAASSLQAVASSVLLAFFLLFV